MSSQEQDINSLAENGAKSYKIVHRTFCVKRTVFELNFYVSHIHIISCPGTTQMCCI